MSLSPTTPHPIPTPFDRHFSVTLNERALHVPVVVVSECEGAVSECEGVVVVLSECEVVVAVMSECEVRMVMMSECEGVVMMSECEVVLSHEDGADHIHGVVVVVPAVAEAVDQAIVVGLGYSLRGMGVSVLRLR